MERKAPDAGRLTRRTALLLCASLLSAALLAAAWAAGTSASSRPRPRALAAVTVINTNDSGPGSLRQAIADASSTDTIDFAPGVTGTITLTSGELFINKVLTIKGPGANLLTVSGNNASRVFNVSNVVQISGLTISGGSNGSSNGAGIFSSGTLTLDGAAVSNNTTFGFSGGGIFSSGELTVRDSTVSGNVAMNNSGGGINISAGTVDITNSTISGNTAAFSGEGGGIRMSGGTLSVTACTITDNDASLGGGIRNSGGSATLRGSIVAGNVGSGPDLSGTFTSQGFNLISNNSGVTITPAAGDKIGTTFSPIDPLLGPLQSNGGPTRTHALLAGSPALDSGDDSLTGAPFNLSTDQRGLPRRFNGRVDIGSFEAQPRTFTVTNTNDSGAGSLRQAITDANNNQNAGGAADTIAFNIAGAGVHTIQPTSALPAITDPVIIDGYTQPGSSPNTKAVGDDAVLLVELNGANAGVSADGLRVNAGSSTIRGLVINGFGSGGIHLFGSSDNVVGGNFIGTTPSGTTALGNDDEGVLVESSGSNIIGGATPAARNLISGNAPPGVGSPGIFISGSGSTNNAVLGNLIGTNAAGTAAIGNGVGVRVTSGATANTVGGATAAERNVISGNTLFGVHIETSGNFVRGNFIGTDAAGTAALGNVGVGVLISAPVGIPAPVDNNAVGGTGAGEGNVIAFNGAAGVRVSDGTGNRILSNSIHSNGLLGIDLFGDGITQNDAGDADGGPNNRQNFPALTSAIITSGATAVAGTLNSTPSQTFFVEFFRSPSCDSSGNGEGQTLIGFVNVSTDAAGNTSFNVGSFAGITPGQAITATATNISTNDTSEFSPCVIAQNATTLAVTNANDSGAGSLRQAITDSNNTPGVQTITFNIPGAGVRTITPLSPLPAVTAPVVIDGYTQPGSSPNTLAVGDDAVLLVELDGTNAGPNVNGLTLNAGNSVVRGLVINRFRAEGVLVSSGGNTIEGCFIGTDASGATAARNLIDGVRVSVGSGNTIGGTTPAARNVISGNQLDGVLLNTGNGGVGANVVRGNYIGTNKGGTAALPNMRHGVNVANSNGNLVGGANAAARNVISGNGGQGLSFVNASSNRIQGNFIGVAADGASALGNGLSGVLLGVSSNNNVVGGTAAGAGNRIANSGGVSGVAVDLNCRGNAVLGNSIRDSLGRGIDLNLDGVTQNDAGDADGGGNNSQNFPVLTSAAVVGGSATIFGTLDSTPNRSFRVEFFANASCDSSGNGEGQTFLGSVNVATDASGNAALAAGPFPGVSAGEVVTATATDSTTNDTSEFSQCRTAATATALTVTNTSDDGEGSLRRALASVEDGGVIDFAPEVRGTVTLASELVVSRRVNINGPGANLLTLSGGNVRRLLNVQPGGAAIVSKLSFSNGKADGDGGAILNSGALTLANCTVSLSKAARGGAVFNAGSLNVEGSTLNSNGADGEGGAVFNAGSANVSASTLSGNVARAGGGIFNGGGGALNVTNTTVSDNRAGERGGGIANGGGQVSVTASTVAANASLGQAHSGGGISNASGALSLGSSIVADNTSPAGADDISGAINSLDFNLIGDASGANVSGATAHNKTGTPLLGPLQNNGGPTDTRALLPGSPALDAGNDALALTTDQRGRPRKIDGDSLGGAAVDIGAFESGFSLSGSVVDADSANVFLADVALTLSGNSVTRTTLTTASTRGKNFTIMDVPAGQGYEIKTKASLQLDATFSYFFPTVCVDVSAAGVVTECGTQDVLQSLDIAGEKRVKRFAVIGGRVTNADGRGVGGVTITLSGPKTTVFNVPECQDVNSDSCGRYEFRDVPTGADYTMTPKKDEIGFFAHPFDNGRGGADMNNLGADSPADADGKVTVPVDFDAGLGPAPPVPSDNFTSPTPDPNRFKSGVVSLAPESFEPAVRVIQGDGQLQITPPASAAPTTQGATQSAAAQVERFNGYVSVRDIDLNTSTSVSVKADQPIADGGEQTVFSVGSDSGNFYRIRVGAPSSGLGPVGAASQVRAGEAAAAASADAPAIFFEAFTGGSKFQSAPAPFDKSVDVFWRLRFEPRTPTPPAVCTDAGELPFVLFETSVDRTAWTPRFCATLGPERTHVAAELLAGVVGNTTRDPGTAKFSDYRVAGRTGIGFERPDTFELENRAQSVEHLRLVRSGDASSIASAASVVLKVGGSTPVASPPPCAASVAPPCKVFFAAGENGATFSFANPALGAAEGDRLTLTLEDPSGGALDADSASLTLDVVDRGFRGNRIGESGFFAAQHYCDFLNRPPDEAGLAFWTNEIEKCGADEHCREVRRINVSAAFFLSIEYKETSYFVYKLYELSFGRMPLRAEMVRDAGAVGAGVVVGREHWQDILEANKRRFVDEWMQGADFRQRFDGLKSADFVDALYANAGVAPSPDVRTNLILELVTGKKTRAQVLRAAAEDGAVTDAHRNRAFVLTQYFGYLRRDPDDVGFNFWLKKLDDFKGDFVAAEMVKAFITSDEYKARFKDKPTPSCGP
jgi:hypothetical protein